jgi:hypothetical protein
VVEQQRKQRVRLTKYILRHFGEKNKQTTKFKTLHRMLFLVLQKDGREGFAGIHLRLTFHQIRIPKWMFLSLTIRLKRMRNKTLMVCSVLVVSLKTTMEKSVYDVRNIADGRTHVVAVWGKILFVSLVRDKNGVILSFYPFKLQLFESPNYSLCFLCQSFTLTN